MGRAPWRRWYVVDGHPVYWAGTERVEPDEWIVGGFLTLRSAEAHVRKYGGRVVWHEQWETRL